jgi:hypothetical protein
MDNCDLVSLVRFSLCRGRRLVSCCDFDVHATEAKMAGWRQLITLMYAVEARPLNPFLRDAWS